MIWRQLSCLVFVECIYLYVKCQTVALFETKQKKPSCLFQICGGFYLIPRSQRLDYDNLVSTCTFKFDRNLNVIQTTTETSLALY